MLHKYTIEQNTQQKSSITIGSWRKVAQMYSDFVRTIAIVDESVAESGEVYEYFREVITLRGGEECKSLDAAAWLWQALTEIGADRQSVLVGVGGGTITDLVGFVASTYMRGIKCLLIPTTLLGQVDAAIGGKCGINLGGYKNMVGTFSLPGEVVCDPCWLTSLPAREWRCGMAEVIKTAIVGDAALFELLESSSLEQIRSNGELCAEIISRAVAVKCAVVREDFKEAGLRRVLNLGHTLAHAIESLSSEYAHGEAVAVGLVWAARLAVERGVLPTEEAERICEVVAKYGLPTSVELPEEELLAAMQHDKKSLSGRVKIVLPERIGKCIVTDL